MQSENKNDSIRFSTRYEQYCFAKSNLRNKSSREVFPITKSNGRDIQTHEESQGGNNLIQLNNPVHSNNRIYDPDGVSPTLNTAQGGNRQPKIIQKSPDYREDGSLREFTTYSPAIRANMGDNHPMVMTVAMRGRYTTEGNTEQQLEPKYDGLTNTLTGVEKDNRIAVSRVPLKFLNRNQRNIEGDYAYTVDSANTGGVMTSIDMEGITDMRIRRLTPIETERLQAFPDNFSAEGLNDKGEIVPISDSQRYRMMGNAVTTTVIRAIVERMFL